MFFFASCYYGDQLKEEDERGSSYNTFRRDEKCSQKLLGNLKGKEHIGDYDKVIL
jgi:hypothetical protein